MVTINNIGNDTLVVPQADVIESVAGGTNTLAKGHTVLVNVIEPSALSVPHWDENADYLPIGYVQFLTDLLALPAAQTIIAELTDEQVAQGMLRAVRTPIAEVLSELPNAATRAGKVLGFHPTTGDVSLLTSGVEDAIALANLLRSSEGAANVGVNEYGTVADAVFNITPEMFGVIAGDVQANAHANAFGFFEMFEYIRTLGGGVVTLHPGAIYWVDFINFVPSNTIIFANGATIKHLDPTSAYGRGGLVVGNSREFNYDLAKTAYLADTYPSSVLNTAFTDPILTQYLEFNQGFVQAQNVYIKDLRMQAVFSNGSLWGGYAINVANAQHVLIENLRTNGWTQAFNFGSDTSPSTPSCYNVRIRGLIVESPDLVRSYYSLGFIANSTECEVDNATQLIPMTAGSTNGSGAATNVVERCRIRNINIPNLGLTVSSEGVLLNNAQGCVVENIDIRNCISAVSTYYTLPAFGTTDIKNNVLRNINGQGSYIISLRAKNAVVDTFNGVGATVAEIFFANNNASNNIINKAPQAMAFGGTQLQAWYLTNNLVRGWVRKYYYIRPAEILLNDKIDTTSWNDNILVATKRAISLYFLWRVPESFKAIDDIRAFLRFNIAAGADNAADLGSTVELVLEQMVTFAGNIGEAPYASPIYNTRVAVAGLEDTNIVAQMGATVPGLVYMADETHGLAGSWYVRIRMTANGANNYLKNIRVAGYL